MRLPETLSDDQRALVTEVMDAHGYTELRPTQYQAFEERILDGGNHLLVAKTGNGKTLCAEVVTKQTLDAGGQVAYLVPSRNLVTDKAAELEAWAGDYTIRKSGVPGAYSHGDVVVATFDSFYRAVLRDTGDIRGFDRVILDDFHEIYGDYRGPAIEKAIAAIKDANIWIVAMSATLGNPAELGLWLDANVIVSDEDRAIPIDERPIEVDTDASGGKGEQIAAFVGGQTDHAPFLMFNRSRRTCESRAEKVAEQRVFDARSDRRFTRELVDEILSESRATERLRELARMMERGVAYHHAGLPADIRTWIEDAVHDGDIACVCCTTTIAYGFDAPIQSVIVADLKRWNGHANEYIGVYEYVQWIGRAARPGKGFDTGFAYPFYSNFEEASARYFGERELEDVTSHVQSERAFRRLLLEIIEMGWTTPEEVEAFVKETLYWTQITPTGAWNRDRGSPTEQLEADLRTHIGWLIEQGFITEPASADRFETTPLGSAAVAFNFETFKDAPLRDIYQLYTWVDKQEQLQPESLIYRLASQFERDCTLGETPDDSTLEQVMDEASLPASEAGYTTAVVTAYWMATLSLEEIEARTEIDATYLPQVAMNVADYLDATANLFTATLDTTQPDWYDPVTYRVRKGVKADEIPVIREVDYLGRTKIFRLRSALREQARRSDTRLEGDGDEPLLELLLRLKAITDETQFRDAVRNTQGIGSGIAANLYEFVETRGEGAEDDTDSPQTKRTSKTGDPLSGIDADVTPVTSFEEGAGNEAATTRHSTLNDFL